MVTINTDSIYENPVTRFNMMVNQIERKYMKDLRELDKEDILEYIIWDIVSVDNTYRTEKPTATAERIVVATGFKFELVAKILKKFQEIEGVDEVADEIADNPSKTTLKEDIEGKKEELMRAKERDFPGWKPTARGGMGVMLGSEKFKEAVRDTKRSVKKFDK